MDSSGNRAAIIECSRRVIPAPGKYLLAHNPWDESHPLGRALFPVGMADSLEASNHPFLGPVPSSWTPGTHLNVRGPLGHGFQLPVDLRRLALVSLGDSLARLLPLVQPALKSGADVAIFASGLLEPDSLPPQVEIHHLDALPDSLSWATLLALDLPSESLPELRHLLGLHSHDSLPCSAQALIWTPMPCGGLADCGACAVPARNKPGYRLACKDGPVFDLNTLVW